MQQYRINYSLLIGLIVGTFLCSGAVYGLWRFQVERKSGWLLSEAEKAAGEKNFHDAVQFYAQYLSIHPNDNDARLKFANACMDLTDADDTAPEDFGYATQSVEITLRNPKMANVPDINKVRRRLVEFYAKSTNFNAALDHLNILLEAEPNNPDLQKLRAIYLARSGNVDEAIKYSYKLVGYDPKTDAFDPKKATAPHTVEVYANLAEILRGKDKRELAEKVANQMVDVNPKDASAWVSHARLRAVSGDTEGAKSDAQKALQLKPEDADVLLLAIEVAAQKKDFEKALEYIKTAKKLHPKDIRIYQKSASLELQQGKFDKGMVELDTGAKAVGGAAATFLLFEKARMQIDQGDVENAQKTIDEMQKARKLLPEINDYLDATKLYAQGKWVQSAEALSKLRPRIAGFRRDIASEVDYKLAFCYERMGRPELAQDYYEKVVKQNPDHGPALAGIQRMKTARGLAPGETNDDPLQKLIADELKKPKAEQNWPAIDAKAVDFAKAHQLDEVSTELMQVQMALVRKDYDSANQHLKKAYEKSPKNLLIFRYKVEVARFDPKVGPAKAMDMLTEVVKQFGDQPVLRLEKADLLIDMNKDKKDKEPLKRDLAALLTGIDSWTPQQQSELWTGMTGRYFNLGMLDESRQYLTLAADKQPNELPLRIALFSMAHDAGDEDGMKAAQDKILQTVGNKSDSAWLYTEARRKMWLLGRGQLGPDALTEIRTLVNQALGQRPDWQELHALLADVDLMSNNPASALKHYDQAEKLGRPPTSAVVRHIRLLVANGRWEDAGKLLDRIPEQARQSVLGPIYTEILFQTNQVEDAIKQARAAAEADPSNSQNQYWYSQLLARSAQAANLTDAKRTEIMNQAIEAMQKAAQLQPEYPDAWFALIRYYQIQKNESAAQKAMRDAQLALSGDNLTMFLARCYEVLHRPFDAETMYREIYETDPNDLERAQQLAAFYLGPLYQRPDRPAKATPLINQILKAGAEKKVPANDNNLLWARRTAAQLLAGTGDYQNLLKAEKLLSSNSRDGSLLIEDKLALAQILATRPEPGSRVKATRLLEAVSARQPLSEAADITLSGMYINDWSKYMSAMETTIAHYPNSVRARELYTRQLLAHGDQRSLDKAVTQVTKLRQIAPDYPPTYELTVRLGNKRGNQQKVLDDLRSRVPDLKNVKELSDAQKQSLMVFASLLTDLKDLDTAEKIYQELAARDPKMVYELARFLGLYRDPALCIQKLNEVYSVERVPDILSVALNVDRERRDKVGDKYDADIQRWLDAGLRENPDSVSLLVVQADFYDLQKRYDEAANVYRKLLSQNDLTGIRRAVVLNNLAYLVALAGKKANAEVDPLKLVQEAMDILGPNSDILDTRAVVLISREDYKAAIQDLELAVMDGPTASKYYHKAKAHLRAGEKRAALEAWAKAEELGLNREALNRMEQDEFEKIKVEIDKSRGKVTKAEPLRKAG